VHRVPPADSGSPGVHAVFRPVTVTVYTCMETTLQWWSLRDCPLRLVGFYRALKTSSPVSDAFRTAGAPSTTVSDTAQSSKIGRAHSLRRSAGAVFSVSEITGKVQKRLARCRELPTVQRLSPVSSGVETSTTTHAGQSTGGHRSGVRRTSRRPGLASLGSKAAL